MVEADFSGNFLNAENCKDGDIGTILTEGEYKEMKNFKGETFSQLVLDIEINNKKLTHNPKTLEGRELVKQWGKDTKKWVGKQFSVEVCKMMAMGKPKLIVQIVPLVEKI
jgi:hypothetical protein